MLGFLGDRAPPESLPTGSLSLGRTASNSRKAAEADIAVGEASAAGCRATASRLAHQRHRTEPEAAEAAIAMAAIAAATVAMVATITACVASGGAFSASAGVLVGPAALVAMAGLAVADAACATA